MEERIWPGSEAAAATGKAGEHFGKAVYLFFLNLPPQPLLPYYIFVGFFFVFLIGGAAGTGRVLQLASHLSGVVPNL